MIKKAILAAAVILSSSPAFAASLVFSPHAQTADHPFTINLGARDLVNAIGLDVEIAFDEDIVRCSSVQFVAGSLPGFSEFLSRIDNDGGSLEIVLLEQVMSGYSGNADSFLVLTFEPVANGAANIHIVKSYQLGDPLLLDHSFASVEAAVDTAQVIVDFGTLPPVISITKLHQNFPNPFNPTTTIRFDIASLSRSKVYLKIFDVKGVLIKTLLNGTEYGNGSWDKAWDGTNNGGTAVQSGVYFCVLETGGQRTSAKLVLLR